eukprot:SAG31_NODE_141_length_22675_cov_48.948879_5_plen_84_part_00
MSYDGAKFTHRSKNIPVKPEPETLHMLRALRMPPILRNFSRWRTHHTGSVRNLLRPTARVRDLDSESRQQLASCSNPEFHSQC